MEEMSSVRRRSRRRWNETRNMRDDMHWIAGGDIREKVRQRKKEQ